MLMNRWLEGIGSGSAGQDNGEPGVRDRDRRPPTGQFIASGLPLRDRHSRPLAAGEMVPARTRTVVVPPRQTDHSAIETGSTQNPAELGVRGSESQVRGKGVGEEVGVLSNQAECVRPAVERPLADVVSIDKYRALVDASKPRDEIAKRRLVGAPFTEDRGLRSRWDDKIDVTQRPTIDPITVVPERHARHPHFASHRI